MGKLQVVIRIAENGFAWYNFNNLKEGFENE